MVCICVYAYVYIQCGRVGKAREGLWITLEYCVDNSAEGVDKSDFIVDKNEKTVDNLDFH